MSNKQKKEGYASESKPSREDEPSITSTRFGGYGITLDHIMQAMLKDIPVDKSFELQWSVKRKIEEPEISVFGFVIKAVKVLKIIVELIMVVH